MNTEDAAILLALHRPGRATEGPVQKALRLAEKEPELAAQLAAQGEFDSQIVAVIQSITPPENLRHKLQEAGARAGTAKPKLRSQACNPAVLTAIVGVLLILGFVAWTVMERMEKFPGRDAAESMLSATSKMNGTELEAMTATTGKLQDWFYMRGFEGYTVPPQIAALPAVGSRIFQIEGHSIAQVAVDRHDSILYVFHASDFGVEIPAVESWRVIEHEGWAAGLRRDGDICSMIAFRGEKDEMRDFLAKLSAP
jgi:hypothetical protein